MAGESGGTSGRGGTSGDGGAAGGGSGECDGCPSGACLSDGTCVECTGAEHCTAPEPECDLDGNICVECLPSDDRCPAGSYCADTFTCEPGCKNGASCASGSCLPTRDCDRCIHDSECAEGRVCATGVCSDPCTGEGTTCGTDRTCCSGHCVDTSRDINHCGACGGPSSPNTCTPAEFCGTAGCEDAVIANLCLNAAVALVRDGQPPDNAAGDVIGAAFALCAPAPTVRSVSQSALIVSNPSTGQPVAGAGELLAVAGGPFYQLIPRWLEAEGVAAIKHVAVDDRFEFQRTSDDSVVASMLASLATPTHDLVVLEVVRDTVSGTLVFIVSGFHPSGTTAGAWYFANVMMPALSTFTKSWYVYEWTDAGGNELPDSPAEFTLLDEAP